MRENTPRGTPIPANWLHGKRALIVGAGTGIGRAVAETFLAEDARVTVLEHDSQKCTMLRWELPELRVVEGDAVTSEASHRAVTVAVDSFGGLDILVNCGGIFDIDKADNDVVDPDADPLSDAFDGVFRTNVLSHLQAVKAAVPALRAQPGSSIILTESASSAIRGRDGVLHESSKFAVRGLVRALARELAPQIRVNGVAPGSTLDGKDHAWSYVFLASDRSRGISGETIRPDGGCGVGTPTTKTEQRRPDG